MESRPRTTPSLERKQALKEAAIRSRYDWNESLHACSPQLLKLLMKCTICEEQIGSSIYGSCKKHGHIICKPCFYGCLNVLSKCSVSCPHLFEDEQTLCKSTIIPINFQNGISQFWGRYLSLPNDQSPCPSSLYGCDFVGFSEIEMLTHSSSCKFKHLRECVEVVYESTGENCGAVFHSITELMNHRSLEHNNCLQLQGEYKNEIIIKVHLNLNYSPSTELSETKEEKWSPLVRMPTSTRADGSFGLIFVDENETSIRVWITSVDPTVKEDISYTVKAPLLPNYTFPKFTYEFTGAILPYLTVRFDKKENEIPYFVIPKNFIRQYSESDAERGISTFRLFLRFGLPKESGNGNSRRSSK